MEIIIIFNNEGMISHCRERLSHALEEKTAMIPDTVHFPVHDPFCLPHSVSGLVGDGLHTEADAEDGDLTFKISNSVKAKEGIAGWDGPGEMTRPCRSSVLSASSLSVFLKTLMSVNFIK